MNVHLVAESAVDNNIMEKDFECIKIKDGLYLGSKAVAYDLEFLLINKFAYIVNCAAELPNLFEEQGVRYTKFKIHQDKSQPVFDEELKRLRKMRKIVEEAEENGMCCLVHCSGGNSRSLMMVTAYLMDRFKWKLRKTIEFLQSKAVFISLTEKNIEELANLEATLARENKLTSTWAPPYADDEEELIAKTFMNTARMENRTSLKREKGWAVEGKEGRESKEGEEKSGKRVQWQDRIEKEQKKEKKRLLAQKKENEKSREKLDEEAYMKKESKTHNLIIPKEKSDLSRKVKKRFDPELDPAIRKQLQQAQLLKLIKKTGKYKKELMEEAQKLQEKESSKKEQSLGQVKEEEKKVYKLTINNYINPNINIIKPPLDKKKKTAKSAPKKDKINRTYSQKEGFKKTTLYEKDSREKQTNKPVEKRNTGSTPVRSRKQRKSQKEKDIKL